VRPFRANNNKKRWQTMVLVFYYILLHRLLRVYFTRIRRCVMEGKEGRENIFISTDERKSDNSSLVLIYLFFFCTGLTSRCAPPVTAGWARMQSFTFFFARCGGVDSKFLFSGWYRSVFLILKDEMLRRISTFAVCEQMMELCFPFSRLSSGLKQVWIF